MRLVLPLAALLVLAGCGGGGGNHADAASASLTISRAHVATGGTAIVDLSQIGYGDDPALALAVQEGDAGGTLTVPDFDGPTNGTNRIYTAPANPGTYHIVGTVTEKSGKVHTKTTTVIVEVPPAG